MYFRKYFEGSVSGYNATKSIGIHGTSTKQTIYSSQTSVVNLAIKDTLLAAGIECEYDATNCILSVKSIPVQILILSNVGQTYVYARGRTSMISSFNTTIFSGGSAYKFYVSLLGDPGGILAIAIGNYASPASLTVLFGIANMSDLRDGSKKLGLIGSSTSSIACVYGALGEQLDEISETSFYALSDNTSLTQNGSLIPLIECIDATGFFRLTQCYMGHRGLTSCSFYNIGGDIYMQLYYQYLIKCTTEIS